MPKKATLQHIPSWQSQLSQLLTELTKLVRLTNVVIKDEIERKRNNE